MTSFLVGLSDIGIQSVIRLCYLYLFLSPLVAFLCIFQVILEAYFPTPDSDTSVTSRSTNDRCFLAVNDRPIQMKDLEKV